jgi:hypothetical protein
LRGEGTDLKEEITDSGRRALLDGNAAGTYLEKKGR